MSADSNRNQSSVGIWARGLFMGVADVVPGFSGGTVALITGIYERLIQAISRFDSGLVRHLKSRDWKAAANHIDFRFLTTLIFGIGGGFVVTLLTVHRLLDDEMTKPYVLAAFLGMVLGSAWFVYQLIGHETRFGGKHGLLTVAGIAVAAIICLLQPTVSSAPPAYFVFLCGAIAICAMILPGISGALILMLLGTYKYFTGIAKELVHRENIVSGLTTSAIFGIGAVVGLLCFSKLLRFLFRTRPAETLSFLFGLMLGSTVRLWPFRTTEAKEINGVEIEIDHLQMMTFDGRAAALFATMIIAGLVVFFVGQQNKPTAKVS